MCIVLLLPSPLFSPPLSPLLFFPFSPLEER